MSFYFLLAAVCLGVLGLCLVAAGWRPTWPWRPRVGSPAGWREACGKEQHRADQWRTLFERQRNIEDLSPAGQRHEQFDIDRQARALGYDVRATRRIEP